MTQYSNVASLQDEEAPNTSAISWAAIFAGALVIVTISSVLTILGVGLGFAVAPHTPGIHSAVEFTVAAAVWMIVVQWLSSALGGFITGRTRIKWPGLHTHEVFFRDTVHGFLAWTLATLVLLGLFASTATAMIENPRPAAEVNAQAVHMLDPYLYRLYRAGGQSEAIPLTPAQHDESALLLVRGSEKQPLAGEDRAYLTHMVSVHTGISDAEAEQRVDATITQLKADADHARKMSASATIMGVLAMLIGAFVASVAGAIGGRLRDQY